MNREVGYIGRGFLLMLVVLAGLGTVHLLSTSERPRPTAGADRANVTNSPQPGEPAVYNVRGKVLFNEHCSACHKLN